jgi:hypothetical protein
MSDGISSPPRCVWEYSSSDSGRWLALFGVATFCTFGALTIKGARVTRAKVAARLGHVDAEGAPTVAALKHQIGRLRTDCGLRSVNLIWRAGLAPLPWPDDARPPAAPPAWLLRLDIPPHVKRCLIGLWSFADYSADGPAIVTPTFKELALRTGQSARAVRSQFALLVGCKWVARTDAGVELRLTGDRFDEPPSDSEVRRNDAGVRCDVALVRPDGGATTATEPATTATVAATTADPNQPLQRTQTLQLPCITLQDLAGVDPAAGQTEFRLAADEPKPRRRATRPRVDESDPAFAELFALHQRLRRKAQAHHGQSQTDLPTKGKHGTALRDRLRAAIAKHGLPLCRRALEWQGQRWTEDVGQLQWSTESVWSPGSLTTMISKSDPAKAQQRDPRWSQGSGIGSYEKLMQDRERRLREAAERGETMPDEEFTDATDDYEGQQTWQVQ